MEPPEQSTDSTQTSGLPNQSRRGVLQAVSGGIVALAGCTSDQENPKSNDSSSTTGADGVTGTETVVFTDSDADATSEPTTSADEAVVFDGGDLESLRRAILRAAWSSSGRLEIAPGTYRFQPLEHQPPDGFHAVLREVEGVTIEGNGATFVFTEPTKGGLRFAYGRDIRIQNLVLNYDPVPMTQGTITTFDPDDRRLVVELDEEYPSLDHWMYDACDYVFASIHRPDGSFIRGYHASNTIYFKDITRIDDRRFELRPEDRSPVKGVESGKRITVVARTDWAALLFTDTEAVAADNVTVRASCGGGVSVTGCTDPQVTNCTVAVAEDSDRQITTPADGFRVIDCVGSARVENCRVDSILDDGIVVQRNRTPIVDIVDERTVDVTEWPIRAKPGDTFDVVTPTGERKGTLPPVSDMTVRFPTPIERGRPNTLTFEEPIADRLEEGDLIGNRETASQNFVVRNNTVRNLRAKTARIAAGRGVIENNYFEGSSQNTIELESNAFGGGVFFPRGPIEDVTVRGNTLVRSGMNWYADDHPAAISLHHRTDPDRETTGRPNRDVTIEENTIRTSATVGISLTDTVGVTVADNTLEDLNRLALPNGEYGFWVLNVRDATVESNRVRGTSDALDGFGIRHRSTGINLAENTVTIDGETSTGKLERRSFEARY